MRSAALLALLAPAALGAPALACETITACEVAVQRAPQDIKAKRAYALALLRGNFVEEALETYRAAVALAPDEAANHEALGTALASQRDYVAALPELERAVALAPEARSGLRMLQLVQEALRLRAAAIATAERLAERGDPIAMFDLAEALDRTEPELALGWLARAAEAGHVAAMERLALAHREGRLGPASDPRAAELWAARAGAARGE